MRPHVAGPHPHEGIVSVVLIQEREMIVVAEPPSFWQPRLGRNLTLLRWMKPCCPLLLLRFSAGGQSQDAYGSGLKEDPISDHGSLLVENRKAEHRR